jgi:hypothetical protein
MLAMMKGLGFYRRSFLRKWQLKKSLIFKEEKGEPFFMVQIRLLDKRCFGAFVAKFSISI